MAELDEPGKGATAYAFSPKGRPADSKSKVTPAPFELSQLDGGKEKVKEREKEGDKEETVVTVSRKGTKIGHRRIDEDGQITYKKQPSSALVSAIQLGIQYSVGRLSSKVERDVLMGDFYEIESVFFPSVGAQETPAHHCSDFRFKAYAPVAFRYFRELFHIAPDDFLISLCHEPLRELANPGASGSLFYCSLDDQFIIKTVQHKEAEFLQKLLPGYYLNLNQNKRTLLPKFFGLYCYQCGGKNIRLVLMNNLLPSGYKIHLKYDLKGSTYKRKASKAERAKSSPTLKDLDFMHDHPDGISLDAETYSALTKTIQRDCRVLESFKIMDYSLLLAIHNVDEAAREKKMARGDALLAAQSKAAEAGNPNHEDRKASEKSTNELAKVVQPGAGAVARNPSARNRDDFAAYWEAIPQHRDDHATPYGAIRARNAKGDRLLLFIGIIDILQSYRLKKRLEHGLKSVVQDGDAISVHRPSFYAKRFQEFMAEKAFKKQPSTKSQITRSPSKKRASFNSGRTRDRARTSSDTEKHLHRIGEMGKNLSARPKLSPSLDAGLANAVPGDVSFMGRETKSADEMRSKSRVTNDHPSTLNEFSTSIQGSAAGLEATAAFEDTATHEDLVTHENTLVHEDAAGHEQLTSEQEDPVTIPAGTTTNHERVASTGEHLAAAFESGEWEKKGGNSKETFVMLEMPNTSEEGREASLANTEDNVEQVGSPEDISATVLSAEKKIVTFTVENAQMSDLSHSSNHVTNVTETKGTTSFQLSTDNERYKGEASAVSVSSGNGEETVRNFVKQSSTDSEPSVMDSKI